MSNATRAHRFVVEYVVEPDHPAYDDPEWAADAAWGALTNMYELVHVDRGDRSTRGTPGNPDRLQVAVNGAPPLTVTFEEVGLRQAARYENLWCRRGT